MKLLPRGNLAEYGKVYIRANLLYFGIGIGDESGNLRYVEFDPRGDYAAGGETTNLGNFTLELSDDEKKELFTILNNFFRDIKESL